MPLQRPRQLSHISTIGDPSSRGRTEELSVKRIFGFASNRTETAFFALILFKVFQNSNWSIGAGPNPVLKKRVLVRSKGNAGWCEGKVWFTHCFLCCERRGQSTSIGREGQFERFYLIKISRDFKFRKIFKTKTGKWNLKI